ncbi:MAG: hypothetical protein AB7G93_23315 [Bdellovibrionales bacterium]
MKVKLKRAFLIVGACLAGFYFTSCSSPQSTGGSDPKIQGPSPSPNQAFANPELVTIQGYAGPAEDPVSSPDGKYLFFDSHTDDSSIPVRLYYATRIDYKTFVFQGEVLGANPAPGSTDISLNGAIDLSNQFYFTTSMITHTSPSIVSAKFQNGSIANGVRLTLSPSQPGGFIMQVSISPDGQTLYYSDCGPMNGNGTPSSSRIAVAAKNADGSFTKVSNSEQLLAKVNAVGSVLYNAWTTANGLELFFTVADLGQAYFYTIYSASRNSASDSFSAPVEIKAPGNNSESGNLSPDGKHLYYHEFTGRHGTDPKIYVVTRP